MDRKTRLLSGGAAMATVVAMLGTATATPAFAKSDTMLSGPRGVQAGHQFRLTVWIGDDAGARQASARLEVLGAHGGYHWYGTWQRLRIDRGSPDEETGTFIVRAGRPGTERFRAVVSGYVTTSPVTVRVR